MKNFTSEATSEIRRRANLVEVISEYVVLKRAGKEHRGLCPFHPEKTPSFHVNPEKGIFKCFGCGAVGDVFTFIQKIKGIDFLDSLRELAHRFGVALLESPEQRQEYDRRTAILMLYQQAAEFYFRLLMDEHEGSVARNYLRQRGVSKQTIEQFKLGYAAPGWDALLHYLSSASKVSPSTLEEAGLVRRRTEGTSYFDLFRNRLMIPIFDSEGRVIAFGGRTLGDDQVKYLNSPESLIYSKGQHLFALNLAKQAIKERDSVIVVEGYFDAITAHQMGFPQTVAALGTALTEKQAKLLVRYTESKRVYLAFDTDLAGEKAMARGVETLNQVAEGIGIELHALRVPGGKDPDECLRADGGIQSFEKAIDEAPLLIDYQLEQAIAFANLKTHTGRIEAAKQIVPILSQIKNTVARGEYIRQWAARIAIREEELLADVGQQRRQLGLQMRRQPAPPRPKHILKSGYVEAERQLLALYLTGHDDHKLVSMALADEDFIEPIHQKIKDELAGIGSQFNTLEDLQWKLMDRLANNLEANQVLMELILKVDELRRQKVPVEAMLNESRSRILAERLNREKSRLRALMGTCLDEGEQNSLGSKIVQLTQLQTMVLPAAKTADEIRAAKLKIDEILRDNDRVNQLETKV